MTTIVTYFGDLALVWLAFAIAIASPGPSNLAVISTSMSEGRGNGFAMALGVSSGSLTWGILTALGVSALIAANPRALAAIKIAGALYLLFLAVRSVRAALDEGDPLMQTQAGGTPLVRSYLRGLLIHLTNPKALLTWMAILAIGIKADMPAAVVAAMVAGCFTVSVVINTGYALLFSTDAMVRGYRRARRPAQAVLAVFFAAAAVKLATMA
jgi:threonine efflux protein